MQIVRVPFCGLSYGEAEYYGWRHCLEIGWWQIYWGMIEQDWEDDGPIDF